MVDDNIYTNLMAQQNLRAAADACDRWPVQWRGSRSAGRDRQVASRGGRDRVPYDDEIGVHSQSEDFTEHGEWDFAGTPAEHYPLLLHYPYFQLYRKQVIKQADLVLAMHLRGDAFTAEEKARNFAYYEARTVRDSSLSAAPQAILAAEVGHLDLAYDYWAETAFTDILDLHDNVEDGVHIAAAASTWAVAVAGFGGMRDHSGRHHLRSSATAEAVTAVLPHDVPGQHLPGGRPPRQGRRRRGSTDPRRTDSWRVIP